MAFLGDFGKTIEKGFQDIGDFIPGIGDARAQDKANKQNLQEAALNRQFQKEMSNTAYQRAMQDMSKAGLNPMLAMNQGGASTPSGGAATVQAASKTGLVDKAFGAISGGMSLSQKATALEQQQTMNDSSIKLNAASAAKNVQEAEKIRIDNVKTKKYEKIHGAAGRVGDKVGNAMNKIMDLLDTNAKKSTDKWHKALDKREKGIKVLGPSTGKGIFDHLKKSFKPH